MKMHIIIASTLVFALVACSGSGKEAQKNVVNKALGYEASIDAEIQALEKQIAEDSQTASSLRYSKEDGTALRVNLYLSQEGDLLKMEEQYVDGKSGDVFTTSYYLKKDFPFASVELLQKNETDRVSFIERKSYYNSKGKVEKTVQRSAPGEDELIAAKSVAVALFTPDYERCKRAINQQGEFETGFQGFVQADDILYVVVGPKGNDAYSSALRVANYDPLIGVLQKNPKLHLNKKLRVEFETVTDPNGFEFQVYRGGKFVE